MRLFKNLFTVITLLLSSTLFAAEDMPAPEDIAPTSIEDVTQTIMLSLADVWAGFIAHLPFLVAGSAILFITFLVASVVSRFGTRLLARSKMRKSLRDLVIRLWVISIWFLGLLLASMVIFPGLTPTKALGGLGLLSVAVGLAFKDIFENFFAGILILWKFPFEEGDFIECNGLMGKVEHVAVRNTTLRKTSGELVIVPNSELFKNPVDVLTDRGMRRITIMAGVAYGEDVQHSVDVITAAVKTSETVRKDQPVEIFPQAFGSSSIDIEVTWWSGATPLDVRRSRGEVVTNVKKALDNAGIEIPFPYRTLTFKEPLPLMGAGGVGSGKDTEAEN